MGEYAKKEGFTYIKKRELKQNLNFIESCKSKKAGKGKVTKYILENNAKTYVHAVNKCQNKTNDEAEKSVLTCLARINKFESASVETDSQVSGCITSSIKDSWKSRKMTVSGQVEYLVMKNASISESAATNLCIFTCPHCSANYSTRISFELHMKRNHQKDIKMTNIESCRFMTKATVHVCQICEEKVFCEKVYLKGHFSNKHKMPLTIYKKKYNCGTYKEQLQKLLESGKLSLNRIGNLCTFKCPKCCRTLNSIYYLRHHKHGSDKCLPSINATYWIQCLHGKIITHKCKICSKLLLCDLEPIRNHLYRNHGLSSITQYIKETGCSMQ